MNAAELFALMAEQEGSVEPTPFDPGLSIAGYTTDIILTKHPDNGTLYCTKSGDLKTMDRDGKNAEVIYNFQTNGYPGHNVNGAIILPSRTMIVALKPTGQTIAFMRSKNREYTEWEEVHNDWNGGRLYRGWDVSPDGTMMAVEYPTHANVQIVRVWKITNDGRDWEVVHYFTGRQGTHEEGRKQIFHMHVVQYDKFTGHWWIGTGDLDPEPSVWVYDGENMRMVGEGTQLWRQCSFSFTEDYVLWGSDGGIWVGDKYQCYMVRLKRDTEELEVLDPTGDATMFNTEPVSVGGNKFFIACGTPNEIYTSLDGEKWDLAMKLRLNPESDVNFVYSWFYNFVDNGDGRVYGYITGIMREDTNTPLIHGTVMLDVTS